MTRRYHRWLAILFGVFLVFISTTGLLSHVGTIVNNGGLESEAERRAEAGLATAPAGPPGFVCPETMTCREKRVPKPGEWNVALLHHLHSGEEFGPVGLVVLLLSGLSLLFFSISGLDLYIQMWRGRVVRVEQGKAVRGGKWFW